jgi:arsenate reductase
MRKSKVLFVCTGNAGRSQMAEALLRKRVGNSVLVSSAGVEPWQQLHPMAVEVMKERQVSLVGHYPKAVFLFEKEQFDIVVTIGEPARRNTPEELLNGRWIHWDIADPADADGTSESLAVFRRTGRMIEERLSEVVDCLQLNVDDR